MCLTDLKVILFCSPCGLDMSPGCSCHVIIALNLYLFSDCLPMEWGSYGLNLHDTLNLAESSSLRIIMIFLLLLLYIISLVTVVQFSHPGTTTEEGERVDCKARFLEGWPVGKIVIFPEYLA